MKDTPKDEGRRAAAKASEELAQLQHQTDQARATLRDLQQDLAEAENLRDSVASARLVEANEQLVLSALRSQEEAEAASRTMEELSLHADLDTLTGLPNRARLLDRLETAIAYAKRHGTLLALLFLDLNAFKQINDTLGHWAGDEVLKLAAHRLASLVREEDTVCRYGGDEFVVLLTEVTHPEDAAVVASKVITALGVPSRAASHVLRLSVSIGISVYPDDGQDAETLIDRADAAMYHAKRQGLGSYAFHGGGAMKSGYLQSPALPSLKDPVAQYEVAMAEYERRHLELREANAQLVMAALSAQELQAAAEQAQRRQKEFLAVLAHELRNPLTPILVAATMLGGGGSREQAEMRSIIEREVMHMSRLVGDLLDVSRLNTGKLRLERHIVDMVGIIDEAVDACRPAMDTHLQHFRIQMPAHALKVDADPVRLAQILRNLLDNASKYTADGGWITLTAAVENDLVVVTVSDSGIGITAEVLPKVFEPFVQDPHAIAFSAVGLGIGLTVVRELVEAHGGSVTASSAGLGLGSQFVIRMPVAAR